MQKFFFFITFWCSAAIGQPVIYTTANAHSHNDYEQPVPLYTAYYAGFGSIEADVFLRNDSLLVAHTLRDLPKARTLDDLYLRPLQAIIQNNKGYVYADTSRKLQLMIDIKTDAISTLNRLIAVLQHYPMLTHNPSLKIVISGSRPDPGSWASYPSFIWFDGVLGMHYSKEALKRIVMMSDDFKKYTRWNGDEALPASDRKKLEQAVAWAHALQKPVRFWGAPDFMDAWQQFVHLNADYINTDSIKALSAFLQQLD
jgi:alkaline phosphatase